MKNKQQLDVVMLSTGTSKVNNGPLYTTNGKYYLSSKVNEVKDIPSYFIFQHLYLTSNDEIKEGEKPIWVYEKELNIIYKPNYSNNNNENCYEIIASSDTSLNLPLIPTQFIEEYVAKQGKIDKVWIEMEEKPLKNGWLHNSGFKLLKPKLNSGYVVILPEEEKLYTREDMEKAFAEGMKKQQLISEKNLKKK